MGKGLVTDAGLRLMAGPDMDRDVGLNGHGLPLLIQGFPYLSKLRLYSCEYISDYGLKQLWGYADGPYRGCR